MSDNKITEALKDFCHERITFEEMPEEAKKALRGSSFINENGTWNSAGLAFKEAVIAKPDPNIKPWPPIRPGVDWNTPF